MTSLSIKIAIVIIVTTISSSVANAVDSTSTPTTSYPTNNVAFLPRRGRQYSSNNNLLDEDENEDIIKCSTTHQSKTVHTQTTDDDNDHDEHLSRHPLLHSESAVRAAVHRANRIQRQEILEPSGGILLYPSLNQAELSTSSFDDSF